MATHPWFAAIVTLWFAALLGLSSIALAPAMLERIVAASGIDSFIAAAAPPLGQTAHLLVALGLAGLGGLLGLFLGRSFAARAKFTRSGARAVVHAASKVPNGDDADTFGEDAATFGEDAPGLGLRDRLARLTGQGDGPRDFADLPKLRARDRHPDAPGRKPLTPSDDMVAGDLPADNLVAEHLPADDHMPVEPGHVPAAPAAPGVDDAVMAAQDVPASDEPLELELGDALGFLAPLNGADPGPASTPALARARLDSLGVVQLTERLAIAMQARRERDARRRQAAAAAPVEAPIALPPLIAVLPREPAPASDHAELDGKAREGGYSSLLDVSRPPASNGAVKAGGNAASGGVSAPSRFPAASDPAENYRALKAALDSIQRLSGTR